MKKPDTKALRMLLWKRVWTCGQKKMNSTFFSSKNSNPKPVIVLTVKVRTDSGQTETVHQTAELLADVIGTHQRSVVDKVFVAPLGVVAVLRGRRFGDFSEFENLLL